MTEHIKTIRLHLERLRRHHEAAARTFDEVSFLDLSHALRIWTELKNALKEHAPDFANSLNFKTGIPAKKVIRAVKQHEFVFSYMPGMVRTYASQGAFTWCPEMKSRIISSGAEVQIFPPDGLDIGKFMAVGGSLDEKIIKILGEQTISRCDYVQWMAAEAVRLSFYRESDTLETVTVSREMVIKRVANTLDGSHPSAAGGADTDNRFDAPIHHLLKFKAGNLPLPYFILLKIAQDILSVSEKIPK